MRQEWKRRLCGQCWLQRKHPYHDVVSVGFVSLANSSFVMESRRSREGARRPQKRVSSEIISSVIDSNKFLGLALYVVDCSDISKIHF